MAAELIGQQQGLVKLTRSQAGRVQGHRDNDIDIDLAWQDADHEGCERFGHSLFAAILERADGFPQWRKIGEEGPGPFKSRRPLLTMLTSMVWCIGRGSWRDKGLVAADTSRLLERTDVLPARGTEEGYWVRAECMATAQAFHRQHKPDGLAAPTDEPILCAFLSHHREAVSIDGSVCFF